MQEAMTMDTRPTVLRLTTDHDLSSAALTRPGRGYVHAEIERGFTTSRAIVNWTIRHSAEHTEDGREEFHTHPAKAIELVTALFLQKATAILDD
jgi:hypothetical protein